MDYEPDLHIIKVVSSDMAFSPSGQARSGSTQCHYIFCSDCAAMDFEKIFADADRLFVNTSTSQNIDNIWGPTPSKTSKTDGIWVASLEERFAKIKSTGCHLCNLFWSHRIPDNYGHESLRRNWTGNGVVGQQGSYHLWAYSTMRNHVDLAAWAVPSHLWPFQNSYLVVSSNRFVAAEIVTAGSIYRAITPGADLRCIWGREVQPLIEFSLLKTWLELCRREHHLSCTLSQSARFGISFDGFQLIDCEGEKVVPALGSETYAALSWRWTETSKTGSWPAVVRDALLVTRHLGLRYLWVDKYCINQGDAQQKHEQICKMDQIYDGAEITIVDAVGGDVYTGLPGVRDTLRLAQPKVQAGSQLLISSMRHPSILIMRSSWFTRGWTYQEGILSRRRLVFTKEQVYYECSSMNCYESLHMPLMLFHKQDRSCFRTFLSRGIFTGLQSFDHQLVRCKSPTRGEQIREFCMHMQAYSSRTLSFESDALNAFRGIRRFCFTKFCGWSTDFRPQSSIFGLPVAFGNLEIFIQSFVISLTHWTHQSLQVDRLCQRRQYFPSWSWLGWTGGIYWIDDRGEFTGFWNDPAAASFTICVSLDLITLDGKSLINACSREVLLAIGDHKDHILPILKISEAFVLDLSKVEVSCWSGGQIRIADILLKFELFAGLESDSKAAELCKSSYWKFIVMYIGKREGLSLDGKGLVRGLIIEQKGYLWERIGSFSFLSFDLQSSSRLQGVLNLEPFFIS